jgi:hypothetical protein
MGRRANKKTRKPSYIGPKLSRWRPGHEGTEPDPEGIENENETGFGNNGEKEMNDNSRVDPSPGVSLATVFSGRELTVEEQLRLAELQNIIYRNFKAFYVVGCALMEIRDRRLYRQTHDTFEAFCRERFEIARTTAYQYIETSKVMDNLRNCLQIADGEGDPYIKVGECDTCIYIEYLPANENQVRPLTRLEPEKQVEVWKKALTSAPDGHVTAKHVGRVVRQFLGEQVRETAEKLKDEKNTPAEIVSREFREAYWILVDVVRSEMMAGSMTDRTRKQMLKNLQGLVQLLSD